MTTHRDHFAEALDASMSPQRGKVREDRNHLSELRYRLFMATLSFLLVVGALIVIIATSPSRGRASGKQELKDERMSSVSVFAPDNR